MRERHSFPQAYLIVSFLYAFVFLLWAIPASAGSKDERDKLALLIASDWEGDTAAHNDLVAMRASLERRGFLGKEIVTLEKPNRQSLSDFLRTQGRQVARRRGIVFLFYAGHGTFTGSSVSDARVGLQLGNDPQNPAVSLFFWDEVIAALNLPPDVTLILLPDS